MDLQRLFNNFQFIEKDYHGNYKINFRKFIVSFLTAFFLLAIVSSIFFIILHIFPPTNCYYDTMGVNETRFVFNFDDDGDSANAHVKNVYLNSNELNIPNKKIYANDGNNYSYHINVPRNISHFSLEASFEAEFPYVSQNIIVDVKRI